MSTSFQKIHGIAAITAAAVAASLLPPLKKHHR
jgi:hypothetical protein